MDPSNLTVGGLWAGAGAGLLGAKMAGFHPAFNIEPRPFVTKGVMRMNFPGLEFHQTFDNIDSLRADLIVGSPDCKVFSNLSTKAREKNRQITSDAFNNDFVKALKLIVHVLQPRFFILENLPNILNFIQFGYYRDQHSSYLFDVKKPNIKTHLRGYKVQAIVLNSIDFKVAQNRKRLFLIGSRLKAPNFDPNSMSNEVMLGLERMRYGETVGEALRFTGQRMNTELPKHSDKRIEGFKGLAPGNSYYGTQNNRRLHYDKPSWTVASSCSRFVHPTEPRTLSVRETARLMGWPDGFAFHGTMGQQLDQVGKSMVPQIPYAITKYLTEDLILMED